MYKIEAHIPTKDPTGTEYSIEDIRDFEMMILTFAHGFTVNLERSVRYKSDGTITEDTLANYSVVGSDAVMMDILLHEIRKYAKELFNENEPYVVCYEIRPIPYLFIESNKYSNAEQDLLDYSGVATWTKD